MNSQLKTIFALHLLLMLFSVSDICSKSAAQYPLFSLPFCLYYGAVFVILFIYAIGWQQIIKRLPLTTAYANRAVTVVWGIIWGVVFFHESMNAFKILGALIIIAGIVLYVIFDRHQIDPDAIDEEEEASV